MDVTTSLTPDALEPLLREWAPWRHLIRFSNGLSTDQFEKGEPFNPDPLGKLRRVGEALPWEDLNGGRALDVGFNCGYNSVALATEHGMSVVGVDVRPRHAKVAAFLADTAGVADRTRFELADAEAFRDEEGFDLIVHFGTLYHLPNPVRALETAASNLRAGGWLALETQVYTGDDQSLSKFIHGRHGDTSNWWALSIRALESVLEYAGFVEIERRRLTELPWIGEDQARALYVCRAAD